MDDAVILNNEDSSWFEATVKGKVAMLQYRLRPDAIVFVHTEVPTKLEGRGLGGKLARAGLEFARARGLKVVPLCPFVAAYIEKHREYLDLVPPEHLARVLAE